MRGYTDTLFRVSPGAQLILAGNKRDLTEQQRLLPSQIVAVAADLDVAYYLTSAKTGDEVNVLFHHLGRLLVT